MLSDAKGLFEKKLFAVPLTYLYFSIKFLDKIRIIKISESLCQTF